jgi:hypothetical protein
MCWCALLEVLNQNLYLKFLQIDFWFEFLDIHMNENTITCHDFHRFKWQNINNYPILIIFLCGPMPFLVCWIVIATTYAFRCKNMLMCPRPQHKLDSKSVVCIFIKYRTKKIRLWNENLKKVIINHDVLLNEKIPFISWILSTLQVTHGVFIILNIISGNLLVVLSNLIPSISDDSNVPIKNSHFLNF